MTRPSGPRAVLIAAVFGTVAFPTQLMAQGAPAPAAQPDTRHVTVAGAGPRLQATLYLPSGPGPHPAVVMVQGAGDRPRDQWPYRPLALHLTSRGYAALVYDKRGLGGSAGAYDEGEDLYVLADDAVRVLETARSLPDLDPDRVGLWGKSQGAWVIAAAADRAGGVPFLILEVGGAVTGLEQNVFARQKALEAQGVPPSHRRLVERAQRAVWTYYATGVGEQDAREAVANARDAGVFPALAWAAPGVPEAGPLPGPEWVESEAEGRLRWFRRHLTFDPLPHLRALDAPVLALFGTADRLTPTAASVRRLRDEAYAGARAPLLTVRIFEGADHGLCPATQGELIVPGCTWSDGYASAITDWLDAVAGPR